MLDQLGPIIDAPYRVSLLGFWKDKERMVLSSGLDYSI